MKKFKYRNISNTTQLSIYVARRLRAYSKKNVKYVCLFRGRDTLLRRPPVEDICVAGLSASKTTKRYFLRVRRVALHQDQLSESASQFIGQGVR